MAELCYRCGGEGHFASDCKEEVQGGGSGRDRDPRDHGHDRTRGSDGYPSGSFGTARGG